MNHSIAKQRLKILKNNVSQCRICEKELSHGARPIVQFGTESKILLIGQAPGIKVHNSRIAWDDASGDLLRKWLDIEKSEFYNPSLFAIVPMGFCYPGKGKSGDLPPRKECAEKWHQSILSQMPKIQLTLLIGSYSQKYYLKNKLNLTEMVRNYKDYLPDYFPLPHPSPRNRFWFKKNEWFTEKVLPELKERTKEIIK